MNYVVLYRESNKFKDVLSDSVIKKAIRLKMSFNKYLILGLADDKDTSYLILKYGDDVTSMSNIIPDRTPKPNIDYVPKRK
jgi:hypothetical protein